MDDEANFAAAAAVAAAATGLVSPYFGKKGAGGFKITGAFLGRKRKKEVQKNAK